MYGYVYVCARVCASLYNNDGGSPQSVRSDLPGGGKAFANAGVWIDACNPAEPWTRILVANLVSLIGNAALGLGECQG